MYSIVKLLQGLVFPGLSSKFHIIMFEGASDHAHIALYHIFMGLIIFVGGNLIPMKTTKIGHVCAH